MNLWILCAGILGIFTSIVHLAAGQIDPIRPFLKSDLEPVPKATLLACWHIVSITLLGSSLLLTYIGWENLETEYFSVLFVSSLYVLFSIVFIGVGWFFFGIKTFARLPQWVLLCPIGVLGIYGTL